MTDLPQQPKLSPREVYCQLLSVQDETECHRLLESLCEGDSVLMKRVQLLLDKRHEAKHGLLANAVGIWKSETDADISLGLDETSVERSKSHTPDLKQIEDGRQHSTDGTVKVIGSYELVKILGEGGMGTVYLARQTTPVQREVALKVIRPERESHEAINRFAKERQALATMEHPNIAQIFDGGVAEDGSHYFAMELVRGVPITEYCETRDLTVEQRLNLFSKLCLAVQHAHSKNLVHRDLKPSNILVGDVDGQPILKVIDFGIAKSFGESADHDTLATQIDQILGTPLYFAPEQVAGDRTRIDNRTDVYALGIVLYELLTGVTPLDRSVLAKSGYRGIERMLEEHSFAAPSARAKAQLAVGSEPRGRILDPLAQATVRLPKSRQRELDWITLKALEYQSARRYDSVTALRKDVSRFLKYEPIEAGPPSRLSQLSRWIHRKKSYAIAIGSVLVALLGGFGLARYGWAPSSESITNASRTGGQAGDAALAWQDTSRLQLAFNAFRDRDYSGLRTIVNDPGFRDTIESHRSDVQDAKVFDLHQMLFDAAHPQPTFEFSDSVDFQSGAFSPQSGRLVVATRSGEIRLYHYTEQGFVDDFVTIGHHPGRVDAIALSPDGTRAVSGTDALWFWDLDSKKIIRQNDPLDAGIETIIWSPDGESIAAGARYEMTWVGDRDGEEMFRVINNHRHEALLFSPDSQSILIPTMEGIDEYSTIEGNRIRTLSVVPLENVRVLCLAGESQQWLVTADRFEEHAIVLDLESGEQVGKFPLKGSYPSCIRASEDGRSVTILYSDGKVESIGFDVRPDRSFSTRSLCVFETHAVQPLADDARLDLFWIESKSKFLIVGGDHSSKLWDWRTIPALQVRQPSFRFWGVLPSTNDDLIYLPAESAADGYHPLFEGENAKAQRRTAERLAGPPVAMSESEENGWVAVLRPGIAEIFDSVSGKVIGQIELPELKEMKADLSKDGMTLAVGSSDRIVIWKTADNWKSSDVVATIPVWIREEVQLVDGGNRVVFEEQKKIVEYDWTTKTRRSFKIPRVMHIELNKSQTLLAVANADVIHVWERESGELKFRQRCDSEVYSLAFASEDSVLLSGHRDGTLRAYHLVTGQPLGVLYRPEIKSTKIRYFEIFPDRNRILATTGTRGKESQTPILIGR